MTKNDVTKRLGWLVPVGALTLGLGWVTSGAPKALIGVFLGASPGAPVPFQPVALPPVASIAEVFGHTAPTSGPNTGNLGRVLCKSFDELVEGEIVVRDEPEMRAVWSALFSAPYDPGLFDFEDTFVILMGGGLLLSEQFEITSVDAFEAVFDSPMEFERDAILPGLAVVATTTLSGPPPEPDLEPAYQVSAVKIDRDLLSDVIYHRAVFAAP